MIVLLIKFNNADEFGWHPLQPTHMGKDAGFIALRNNKKLGEKITPDNSHVLKWDMIEDKTISFSTSNNDSEPVRINCTLDLKNGFFKVIGGDNFNLIYHFDKKDMTLETDTVNIKAIKSVSIETDKYSLKCKEQLMR